MLERDRPGAQQQREPGGLRHAQVRPALLRCQRPGPPRHRPDRHRGRPHRPAALRQRRHRSTTPWACSAPTRPSSRSTAARSTDARHYVAETIGPGQTADALVVAAPSAAPSTPRCSCTTPACCCTTATWPPASAACSPRSRSPRTGSPARHHRTGQRSVASTPTTLTATVDDASRGGTASTGRRVLPRLAVHGHGDRDDRPPARRPSTGPRRRSASSRASTSSTSAARTPRDNWGPLTSVLVDRRRRRRPDHELPAADPVADQPRQHGGVAVSATGGRLRLRQHDHPAAEYFIDAGADRHGHRMTVNTPAPVASLDATIPAARVNGLAEGSHVVSIQAQDAQGNWGDPVTVNLVGRQDRPDHHRGHRLARRRTTGRSRSARSIAGGPGLATTMADPIAGSLTARSARPRRSSTRSARTARASR